MLDIIETEVTGPVGPTGWMEAAKCTGKSDLFFAPFAERPEARVRREAKAGPSAKAARPSRCAKPTHAPTENWASGVASRSRNVRRRLPSDHTDHRSQAGGRRASPFRDGAGLLTRVRMGE